jgi:AraC family transcriptional regulator
LEWLDAAPDVSTRDFHLPRPVLAMLERGRATAQFGFGNGRVVAHEFSADDLGLFVPGIEFKHSTWHCEDVRRVMIDLDTRSLPEGLLDDELLGVPLGLDTGFKDVTLASLVRQMLVEVAGGSPNGALYAQSLSLGVLTHLASSQRMRHRGFRRERGRLTSAQLQRVLELINEELDSDLGLADLAAAAGLSPTHFTRLFRRTQGCAPHQYVIARRIERAKILIRTTSSPLAQIAIDVGFSTQSHMNAVFNRVLRMTPGQWRQSLEPDCSVGR